eukprot:MONOS_16413.1-p1 / transcript=MONOS_16413.1 / gene=MONOS_16413 / organism=Monocercomonoides_exilis_PA203 / gene_product=unspecified product / transcript_product=unspecified product / location=Mono_scaffold01716:1855-4857(-) / protein_length=1000 / sequence_SO=supercontig / SO=protein_coding / is_pseudo=false
MDETEYFAEAVDLMGFIVVYQSDIIFVSSKEGERGEDTKKCGILTLPCATLGYGMEHLAFEYKSQLVVIEEGKVDSEIDLFNVSVTSRSFEEAVVRVELFGRSSRRSVIECSESVTFALLHFVFGESTTTDHSSFIRSENGITRVSNCSFSSMTEGGGPADVLWPLAEAVCGEVVWESVVVNNLNFQRGIIWASTMARVVCDHVSIRDIGLGKEGLFDVKGAGNDLNMDEKTNGVLAVSLSSAMNVSSLSNASEALIQSASSEVCISMFNCTFSDCRSVLEKGSMMKVASCSDVSLDSCLFDGMSKEEDDHNRWNGFENAMELCRWNGSLIDVAGCETAMKYTTIWNSWKGGLSVSGGKTTIEKGEFANNTGLAEKYPSLRRNALCSGGGELNVASLKGGDGIKDNGSLWFLNEGCELGGIASERLSALFIPILNSVETERSGSDLSLRFKGLLLLPCNLSFRLISSAGSAESVETYELEENEFVSESEVCTFISLAKIEAATEEEEVFVAIAFGNHSSASSTERFIVKNRSKSEASGNDKSVEGGKEGKFSWVLIVCIVIVVILLIVSIIFIVRWKKVKNEAEDLREIVNDNIRKDPKAFEMVTMEMSPEEQWRRAEREAEKKNEERIKKRVYEKTMEHSESSEHLLSESGSTEYILGRDSDKIPEWALEKVDEKEEEETRKITPSPSISSISSTDTSDTDSSFIHGEDLCPTTSSMSNLVDAMACSCPYEKLIVDLRDSLFMLLHGLNKTKEMAIGTPKEREMTGAQILFWVANGALHSFDEMENPLQSLTNLSPHIVLFSEHMVITVAMHSDCSSSSDDSDSSSISSSTIVTSSSDISLMSRRGRDSPPPSSAFEDDEDNRYECLRWKAPELLNGIKKHATKKTVAFSIGMMLWECLTLNVPFGEYEAAVAGQKIANGERPNTEMIRSSKLFGAVRACLSQEAKQRLQLGDLKREFFQLFPAGATIMTMSDAIIDEEVSGVIESKSGKGRMNADQKI